MTISGGKREIFLSSVMGNYQWLDGGAMFGNVPRPMWSQWCVPDSQGRIRLACRALLVETEGKKILCEVGIGAFFEPKLAQRFGVESPEKHVLLESLQSLGLTHSQIDVVILSHLHFDHAGGLLPSYDMTRQNKPWRASDLLFPNAQYVVGRTAWERAKKPHSRDRASFIAGLAEALEESGRLVIVDGENPPPQLNAPKNLLRFFYTDGHTPGQMHTIVRSENNHDVIFAGDLIPGTAWIHLPITMGYDRFAEQVIDEKKSLYERVDHSKTFFFFTHDDQTAMSRILKDELHKYRAVDEHKAMSRFFL